MISWDETGKRGGYYEMNHTPKASEGFMYVSNTPGL